MKTYVFRVVIEPDEDRWIAYCPILEDKGGATRGCTREEALKNIKEVIDLTIQGIIERGEVIPVALSTGL
jgi:predicted RNase H-like HicB family nuclease